ncbi:hypothetical protein C2G38_2170358 [Gigaspora rosea]|uniref:Uncharacterized protein n=1 Tax=Gigaspora rosea TaxID=44941 RepID=A0A397VXM4_9GLOM|nr:hypothetical protein C2G38_2170358 [Gigaspora rosea]
MRRIENKKNRKCEEPTKNDEPTIKKLIYQKTPKNDEELTENDEGLTEKKTKNLLKPIKNDKSTIKKTYLQKNDRKMTRTTKEPIETMKSHQRTYQKENEEPITVKATIKKQLTRLKNDEKLLKRK